ncbi:hypothetical protein ACNQR7_02475 [Mycolicibacterium senegalense]|uniref:putative phage holin n=1 Tax=Mycolicibacterium senegalense TaxID=1796 RepID=UPI003AB0B700
MRWIYGAAVASIVAVLVSDIWLDVNYRFLANISLISVAVLVVTFAVLYLTRSRWWTNRIGKIYLAKSIVLSLVLIQIVMASWWDADYPGRQHLRFAIYTLGAVAYLPMLVSLWREQQRDRKRRQ